MPFAAPADDLIQASGRTAFGDDALGASAPSGHQAKDIGDAIISGLQSSATGLALRGKLPEQQLGEDAPWYHRLASGGASVVADLPLSVVGGVGGAAVGSAAGPAGTLIGGGAGAFAAPMALRDALVEAYSHNYALSWAGAWEIAKAGLKGGGKGALVGGLTAGAGRVAAPLFQAGGRAGVAIGTTGAELATLTTASAALEGHMPTWQDFADNAVLLGGLKASMHVAQGLRNIYAETGRTPEQVVGDAARDPAIAEALKKPSLEIPAAYRAESIEQRVQAALGADERPDLVRRAIAGEKDWLPPGEKPSVAWEYVTDRESAQGVLRAVTERYGPEIEAQRRGEVPNADSLRDAQALLRAGETGEHVAGAAENSSQILVRAALLRDALNHTKAELQKIQLIPEAELTATMKLQALASIERTAMLNAEFAGVRAEAGRALQILRALKRDPTMLGEADMLVKLYERKGSIQDIAKFVETFKDPTQLAEFARRYTQATTLEKVNEGFKASILSGPLTQLANVLGNTTKWFVEIPENVISASLTAMNKAAHGDPMTIQQWKARAFAGFYGLQHGSREALYVAAEVWRGKGEHLEKADVYRGAIEGRAGEIIRTPFKLLQVEDALFRTVAERGKAYEMAVDRAVKEGFHLETQEAKERIAMYTQRPELGLSDKAAGEAIAAVQQAGAESVFAQRLGPKLEMVQAAMQGTPMSFIVPFVRTPANLVSWAIQHVPILNFMSARWRSDYAAGGEARSKAIARVTIGIGLTMTAYELAANGILTGGGLFDKEEGGTKRAAGWQPYSILVGDKYYSYQRIEPVAKVIGLAADLVELQKATKDDMDKSKIAAMLVLLFGNATVSTTYLSGLSNAIQAVTDPTRFGENFLEQYATSVVPKVIGQTVGMADPYKREVHGVVDAIQSQLPWLREKLMPKRDVWGEPSANERWFAVMPIATSEASKDKVKTEAARLQLAIQDVPKFMEERGPFNPRDKRLELTDEQRDVYRQVSGKHAMEILTPIVNAKDWEIIPDFAKAAIFKGVIEATRREGAQAALPADSAAREALRHKIVDRIIKETQQAIDKK